MDRKKPILYVTCQDYPEVADVVREVLERETGHEFKEVDTREAAERELDCPENYRGVFFVSLRIRTGKTKPSEQYMGNGIDLVNLSKDKGLPVIVLSEAGRMLGDEEIMKQIKRADRIFVQPEMPGHLIPAVKEVFG